MLKRILITLPAMFCWAFVFSQNQSSGIWLEKQNNCARLIIAGKPFLIPGGEFGDSSASNMEYMHWSRRKTDLKWGFQKLNLYNSPREIEPVKSGLY